MSEPPSLDPRLTEALNPRTRDIDRADALGIVRLIQREDRWVPTAVEKEAPAIARAIEAVADRLRAGGRLFYVGAGTSGRLGVLDASECPPTFGTDPRRVRGLIAGGREALVRSLEGAEDDEEAARRDLREAGAGPGDFVLGIATSGTTPYVLAAVEEAAALGAETGFLSCTPPPERARRAARHRITPLVGPEVIAGSTRMKAGTATKLVLNTLSTGVMIRLGKVHRNLMVDLWAASRKLADRSVRIVQQLCGVDAERARRALVAAGGSAKVAVAMLELEASRAAAERLLDAAGGRLGETLERWKGGADLPYYACYPAAIDGEAAGRLREALATGPRVLARALEERTAREENGHGGEGRSLPTGAPVPSGGSPPPEASSRPRTSVPAGGPAWDPAAHLAHLVQCERTVFRPRLEAMLDPEGSRRFEDREPAADPPGRERPAERLLALFREERERTVALLPEPASEVWERRAWVGREEVALHQLLRGMAHHDRAHADRILQRIHPALLGGASSGGDAGGGA